MPWQSLPGFVIITGAIATMGAVQHGVQQLFHGEVSLRRTPRTRRTPCTRTCRARTRRTCPHCMPLVRCI